MARPLRVDVADGWYHVMGRGIERCAIFHTQRDRERLLELLESAVESHRILIHAYVLMTNHYHLIVQTPDANLSAAMQWINLSYSAWFNTKHERVGPLFQGRFKSVPIEAGQWAYETSLYLHMNPVMLQAYGLNKRQRKGEARGYREPTPEEVAARLEKLRNYRWSSYRAYAGYVGKPDWLVTEELLKRATRCKTDLAKAYRNDVKYRLSQGVPEPVRERLADGFALGSEVFAQKVRELARGGSREVTGKQDLRRRVTFKEVVGVLEQMKGVPSEQFMNIRGDWGRPLAYWAARRYCGMTLKEIGDEAGGRDYAAVGVALSRFHVRLEQDRILQKCSAQMKRMLNVET
jgi:putative transposase